MVEGIVELVRSSKRPGDVVHGHSSHHPKAIELYRDRPILYGCGEFLDDYEGIRGYEEFRSDLVLMYFLTVDLGTGGSSFAAFVTRRIGIASTTRLAQGHGEL